MSSLDSAPRCQHVKIDGTPCGSPALADNPFCFFHERWKEQYVDFNQRPSAPAGIHLPVLEDAASIQVVLAQVMHLLLTDQIDNKKAGLLLYALQTASSNLARMPKPPEIKEEDPWAGEGPSTESLWTVLGIEPSEVLRVDKELKAEKAAKEAQEKANQYKMDEPEGKFSEGTPVGNIHAVAASVGAGVLARAAAPSAKVCEKPRRGFGMTPVKEREVPRGIASVALPRNVSHSRCSG